jgi:hypothetical protein
MMQSCFLQLCSVLHKYLTLKLILPEEKKLHNVPAVHHELQTDYCADAGILQKPMSP